MSRLGVHRAAVLARAPFTQRRFAKTKEGYAKSDYKTEAGVHVELPSDTTFGSNPKSYRGQERLPIATEPRTFDITDAEAHRGLVKMEDPALTVTTRYNMDHEYYFGKIKKPQQTVPMEVAQHAELPEDERRVREGQLIVPETWEEVGLEPLVAEIAREWVGPAPSTVQKDIMPALFNITDRDLMFSAVTGTGKTVAYCLAALQHVTKEQRGITLILVPSVQLAFQVYANILKWSKKGEVFGRTDKEWLQLHINDPNEDKRDLHEDYRRLRSTWYGGPRIVIAQPERWADYLLMYRLSIPVRRIILDEALTQFNPLDPFNSPDIERHERTINPMAADILMSYYLVYPAYKSLMRAQVVMLTATFNDRLEAHVNRYFKPNAWTHLTTRCVIPSTIDQKFIVTPADDEMHVFLTHVHEAAPRRAVVFVSETQQEEFRIALSEAGRRVRVFKGLKDTAPMPFQDDGWDIILMAHDDCYGVDLPAVSHVFVVGCPRSKEEYTHMAGRTGRFGSAGKVLAFVREDEVEDWHLKMYLMDIKWAKKAFLPSGLSAEEQVTDIVTQPPPVDETTSEQYAKGLALINDKVRKRRLVLYNLAGQREKSMSTSPTSTLARFMSQMAEQQRPRGQSLSAEEIEAVKTNYRTEFVKKAGALGLWAEMEAEQQHMTVHQNEFLKMKAFKLVQKNYKSGYGKMWAKTWRQSAIRYRKEARRLNSKFTLIAAWREERLLAQFPTTNLLPDDDDPNPTVPVVSRRLDCTGGVVKKWPVRKALPPYPGHDLDKRNGTFDWDLHHTDEEMSPENLAPTGDPDEECVVVPASATEARMLADSVAPGSPPR